MIVSVVHVVNGPFTSPVLDNRRVRRISAYLVEGDLDRPPSRLAANAKKAFVGSYILGMGYTFDDGAGAKGETESIQAMHVLIRKNARNAERIVPYIGGEEINSDPHHAYSRYAIDFFDRPLGRRSNLQSWSTMTTREKAECHTSGIVPLDYPEEVAEDWPDLIDIIRRRAKPDRDKQKRKALRERWWQYAEKRPGLYRAIAALPRVLVCSRIGKRHLAFTFLPKGWVYNEKTIVVATDSASYFDRTQFEAARVVGTFF